MNLERDGYCLSVERTWFYTTKFSGTYNMGFRDSTGMYIDIQKNRSTVEENKIRLFIEHIPRGHKNKQT